MGIKVIADEFTEFSLGTPDKKDFRALSFDKDGMIVCSIFTGEMLSIRLDMNSAEYNKSYENAIALFTEQFEQEYGSTSEEFTKLCLFIEKYNEIPSDKKRFDISKATSRILSLSELEKRIRNK